MKISVLMFLMVAGYLAFAQKERIKNEEPAVYQVAVFLACECPVSQKYISKLNDIYLRYGQHSNLKWRFIVPGKVSKKEIRSFIKEYNVKFSLERDDHHGSSTKYFRATVTPEVIIRSGRVLYRGAIDNWFYELGKYRQTVTEQYLIDAIESILKGQDPLLKETQAVGCPIQSSHL